MRLKSRKILNKAGVGAFVLFIIGVFIHFHLKHSDQKVSAYEIRGNDGSKEVKQSYSPSTILTKLIKKAQDFFPFHFGSGDLYLSASLTNTCQVATYNEYSEPSNIYSLAKKTEVAQRDTITVIVVPHFHNDLSWKRPMDEVHSQEMKHAISSIVTTLHETLIGFVWNDVASLAAWWEDASSQERSYLRKLVNKGRFEVLNGAWVVPDNGECAHYATHIHQLMEGHNWLQRYLNIFPSSGWVFDPYGIGSTFINFLKEFGITNTLLHRFHHKTRQKFLSRGFQFRWASRQNDDPKTDVVYHALPYEEYESPFACGPDFKVCCEFDFLRLPDKPYCPCNVKPAGKNTKAYASKLVEQFHETARIKKRNVILVTMGNDLKFISSTEFLDGLKEYMDLFSHISLNSQHRAQVRFGTVADYLRTLKRYEKKDVRISRPAFLTDKLFIAPSEADVPWAAYHVTRTDFNILKSWLEYHIRIADTLVALSNARARYLGDWRVLAKSTFKILTDIRQRALLYTTDDATFVSKHSSWAQHRKEMTENIMALKDVIHRSVEMLLIYNFSDLDKEINFFNYDDIYHGEDGTQQVNTIHIVESFPHSTVVIFNSLSHGRSGVISLYISRPDVIVVSQPFKIPLNCQVNLSWKDMNHCRTDQYELQCSVDLPGFSLTSYLILPFGVAKTEDSSLTLLKISSSIPMAFLSQVEFYNLDANLPNFPKLFDVQSKLTDKLDLELKNEVLSARVSSKHGTLVSINSQSTGKIEVEVGFSKYISQAERDKSGVHRFVIKDKEEIYPKKVVPLRVVRGPLSCKITAFYPQFTHESCSVMSLCCVCCAVFCAASVWDLQMMCCRTILYKHNASGSQGSGIHIRNHVHARVNVRDNMELAMTISTSLKSETRLYTDLSAFQMKERPLNNDLPLPLRFNPITSMAFLQDNLNRITLMTSRATGVTSQETGTMEVLLKRVVGQEPGYGGVFATDSFVLLIEQISAKATLTHADKPSLLAYHLLWELQNPPMVLPRNDLDTHVALKSSFMSSPHLVWPYGLHVESLRPMPSLDCSLPSQWSVLLLNRVEVANIKMSRGQFRPLMLLADQNKQLNVRLRSLFHASEIFRTSLNLRSKGRVETDWIIIKKPGLFVYQIKIDFMKQTNSLFLNRYEDQKVLF